MPPSPREYLQSHPEAEETMGPFRSEVMASLPFTDFLADIEPETSLELLDTLSRQERFDVKNVLQHLPPVFIVEEYGLDTLAWTVVNAYPAGRELGLGRHAMRGLERLAGVDRRSFEVALSWSRRQSAILRDHEEVRTADVLFLYGLADSLAKGAVEGVDLPTHLQTVIKPNQTIDPQRYNLVPLRPEGREVPSAYAETWGNEVHEDEKHGMLKYKMTLAAPTGLALMYDGRPTAFASFGSLKEGEVIIYQMQGVRARRLDPQDPKYELGRISFGGEGHFDWTALFVNIVEELAIANGTHTLSIRSAHNNPWQKNEHLSLVRGLEIYDETADRLDFQQGDDLNWHKTLA